MTAVVKKTLAVLGLGAALAVPAVQAGGSLDLSLSNDDFRFAWDATQANSGMHVNLAWLHNEDDGDMLEAGNVVNLFLPFTHAGDIVFQPHALRFALTFSRGKTE